jgi:hypothetical protein
VETECFGLARATAFERLVPTLNGTWGEPVSHAPMYFFNIRTGVLDEAAGSYTSKQFPPFVVASYVWTPQYLPVNPFQGLFPDEGDGAGSGSDQVLDDPEVFGQRVAEACRAFPEYVSEVTPEDEGFGSDAALGIKLPRADQLCDKLSHEYQLEVYRLLAREAHRRGVNHIWMDSICIDQDNPSASLWRMSEIYGQAVCCVVVGEVLRRKLCFNPASSLLPSSWGPSDDVLAWIVGFHHLRVWLFQETLLPHTLVTRAGNLRINTTAFIARYRAHLKKCPEQGAADLCGGGDRQHRHFELAMRRYPNAQTGRQGNAQQYLESMRSRASSVRQDYVYATLGLYTDSVLATALRVDYRFSLGCVFAVMTFLRISIRDYSALLILRRSGEPKHAIRGAPSWMPTGYGGALLNEEGGAIVLPPCECPDRVPSEAKRGPMNFMQGDMYSWQPCRCTPSLNRDIRRWANVLKLGGRMHVLSVVGVRPIKRSEALPRLGDYNVLLTLRAATRRNDAGGNQELECEGVVEPLGYLPSGDGEGADDADNRDFRRELGQIREAAARGDAVAAQLSQRPLEMGEGFGRKWIMLVLCTADGGQTWSRRGLARVPESFLPEGEKAKKPPTIVMV